MNFWFKFLAWEPEVKPQRLHFFFSLFSFLSFLFEADKVWDWSPITSFLIFFNYSPIFLTYPRGCGFDPHTSQILIISLFHSFTWALPHFEFPLPHFYYWIFYSFHMVRSWVQSPMTSYIFFKKNLKIFPVTWSNQISSKSGNLITLSSPFPQHFIR